MGKTKLPISPKLLKRSKIGLMGGQKIFKVTLLDIIYQIMIFKGTVHSSDIWAKSLANGSPIIVL